MMRHRVAALVLMGLLTGTAAPAGAAVRMSAAPTTLATDIGETVAFTTTITNEGARAEGALIAHLNILSIDRATYVDPEDWSTSRTRYLPPLPPGGTQTLRWAVKAVGSGVFSAYVAIVRPESTQPPTSSPAVTISVASRRTLNSGGILPLAIGVPLLLAVGVGTLRVRRRAA